MTPLAGFLSLSLWPGGCFLCFPQRLGLMSPDDHRDETQTFNFQLVTFDF